MWLTEWLLTNQMQELLYDGSKRFFDSFSKRHFMTCRYPFASAISIALFSTGAAWLVSLIPLVPSWQTAQIVVIASIAVVSALIMNTYAYRSDSASCLKKGAVSLVSVLMALAIWIIVAETAGANTLRGEELVARISVPQSHDRLYVYHLSEIPDGFIYARVLVSRGRLPLTKEIGEKIDKPFLNARKTPSGLSLIFGPVNSTRFLYCDGKLLRAADVPDERGNHDRRN